MLGDLAFLEFNLRLFHNLLNLYITLSNLLIMYYIPQI